MKCLKNIIMIMIIIIIIIIIIINNNSFDEPHDVFEVHYLMKTIYVSNETSSIVSCTVKKYKKNMQ